ncbi:hypothetical protein J7E83_18535 [Arthrobacter sp. ISL-48]|uniref:hypothetical protein n=1 Tax=Arthrobacter sp. ISL-48 TaxID=2819110 RepID=UPI001BEC9043|nr:hypothetical protein [Arthrobacter sp. ISL-48]MBT2534086.1 hypothetical protein [Arthrobacter sp. ISL-48]
MTNDQIVQWQCDKCGGDIAGSQGYLSVDMPAVNLAERARQEREIHPDPSGAGGPGLTPDTTGQPQKVQWRVYHSACDPDSGSMSYSIDVAEIAVPSRVLAWTLHFMDTKDWIRHTDWTSFVRARTGVDLRQERT